LTICPCCGFKFHGALSSGCKQCGARAVGEPLPKPAYELPSYGRSLVLAVSGSFLALVFLVQTIIAFFQHSARSLGFWTWVAAGETAAWRLKWISIPVLFVTLWFGLKLYRSIKGQPERFCGLKYARRGLLASAMVALLISLLIGITVPARLRQRQMAKEAANLAQWYTFERAMLEYKLKYRSYPADMKDLLKRIPDPDGTLAALDPTGYHPTSDVAVVATEKSRRLRGTVYRNASLSSATDDATSEGLSFTNYVMRFPGEDKILGTEDDWLGRDGVIVKISEVAKGSVGRSVSAGALQP
jgi:hypothetical protein